MRMLYILRKIVQIICKLQTSFYEVKTVQLRVYHSEKYSVHQIYSARII